MSAHRAKRTNIYRLDRGGREPYGGSITRARIVQHTILLAPVFALANTAAQSNEIESMADLNPTEKAIEEAAYAFEGEVTDCSSSWMTLTHDTSNGPFARTSIYTVCSATLEELLKGQITGNTVQIFRFGGRVGTSFAVTSLRHAVVPGSRGTFILHRDKHNGQFWLRNLPMLVRNDQKNSLTRPLDDADSD